MSARRSDWGDAERLELPNGLVVLWQRTARVPVVAIAAAVDAGAAADPPGKAGLATATVELLRTRTTTRDEESLALAFADLGATLRAARGQDWVDVSTQVLARDFEKGLGLIADVLRRPAFAPEKLERIRRELHAERRSGRTRAEELLVEAFYAIVYAGHPYATPINGTDATSDAIGREDVVRFHAESFAPQRTTFAVGGDVDGGRVEEAFERAFGDWRAAVPAGTSASPGARTSAAGRPGIFFVHKDDQTQAHVRIGHPIVPRNDPDFDRLLVANYILGGAGLASRIADSVRTRGGLAYSAGSFFVPRRLGGPFAASAQTKSGTCVRAIELTRAEIERIRSEPFPEADLETARAQYAGSLPFRLETNAHKAGALLEGALFGLGPDHLRQEIETIGGLAPEEVRQAAERHFAPERATVVVAGERGALLDALSALGPVREEEVPA